MDDATGVEGTPVKVSQMGFVSSDQGELFLTHVEGLPNACLGEIPLERRPSPSQVDSLVAVISRDGDVRLFVNEADFVVRARAARSIEAGDLVGMDDFLDIATVSIPNVEVPGDAGFVCLFSVGWR